MDENTNHSIVNAALVGAAVIAYFTVSILFETFAGIFGPVARLYSSDVAKHAIPLVSAMVLFLALFLNKKVHVFFDEAVMELRKVVWPSRKDTISMTIVCAVMVIGSGIGFGIFDLVSSQLIKLFVN